MLVRNRRVHTPFMRFPLACLPGLMAVAAGLSGATFQAVALKSDFPVADRISWANALAADGVLADAGATFNGATENGNAFASTSTRRQIRFTQGGVAPDLGWNGLFVTGEKIFHSQSAATIEFQQAVAGVGFQIHHDWLNLEATHTLRLYDGQDVLIEELVVKSTATSAARGTGSAVFMGLLGDEAVIRKIVISSFAPIPTDQDRFGNFEKFATNDILLAAEPDAVVPEPSSWLLAASGLAALFFRRRN